MQVSGENNALKGLISSLMIHLGILLICYFAYITVPFPKDETEGGGIVINYGTVEEGMGTDLTSLEEPFTAPDPDPEAEIAAATARADQAREDAEEVVTQDTEDAPVVKAQDEQKQSNTSSNADADPKADAPAVDSRALYKGKRTEGAGGGDGTGSKPGNQGSPDGDPNSADYSGGNGTGVALNLSGRRFLTRPVIQDRSQEAGRIVVQITADKTGTITAAKAGYRGTTISNNTLWAKCEKAVLGAKLNSLETAPDIQVGTVVFTFILE